MNNTVSKHGNFDILCEINFATIFKQLFYSKEHR